MSGTTLRFPYGVASRNCGALIVESVNTGDLSVIPSSTGNLTTSVTNAGDLSRIVSNEGALRLALYNPSDDNTYYAGGGLMADIIMYEGDYGYDLQFTVSDVDGDPFNLSGASVKFQMAKKTDTALKVDRACVLDPDPTTGQCSVTMASTDLDTPGIYFAELEITIAGSNKKYTIGDMNVEVRRVLPYITV